MDHWDSGARRRRLRGTCGGGDQEGRQERQGSDWPDEGRLRWQRQPWIVEREVQRRKQSGKWVDGMFLGRFAHEISGVKVVVDEAVESMVSAEGWK